MLYKVALTFESVNKLLQCDHSIESFWAVLSCDMCCLLCYTNWFYLLAHCDSWQLQRWKHCPVFSYYCFSLFYIISNFAIWKHSFLFWFKFTTIFPTVRIMCNLWRTSSNMATPKKCRSPSPDPENNNKSVIMKCFTEIYKEMKNSLSTNIGRRCNLLND